MPRQKSSKASSRLMGHGHGHGHGGRGRRKGKQGIPGSSWYNTARVMGSGSVPFTVRAKNTR